MFNVSKVVNQLGLKEGDHVADLGSGIGHFSIPIAKKVGTTGVVYSVDVHRDILTRLTNDAKDQGLSNIQTIWGDIESPGGTHVKDSSVDIVLFVNILFQLHNRPHALREAIRIAKNGGRIAVVDWHDNFLIGPTKDKRFSLDELKKLFEHFGLVLVKDISVGSYHYGMIFKKEV